MCLSLIEKISRQPRFFDSDNWCTLRPGFANMLPCHFLGDVPSGQETQALGKGRLLQRGGAGQEEDCDCGGVNSDDARDVNEVSYFEAA